MTIQTSIKLFSISIATALLLSACASGPKPEPRAFDTAENAIAQAVSSGAEEHAPTELTRAREKLAEARHGMEVKQFEVATYLIEQAEINAELAIARSLVAKEREKVSVQEIKYKQLLERMSSTYGKELDP